MALLTLLSLIGMQLRNGIVLVEEIKRLREEEDRGWLGAITVAAVSRVRPVTMAAITTILGMLPLLGDVFFLPMADLIELGASALKMDVTKDNDVQAAVDRIEFEAGLRKRLPDLNGEASIAQRVRSTLLEMLPSGQSSIKEAARRLAMSKRSLQRLLSDESSSFKEILNATRKELAQHYLARSSISPGEISYLLGFQDSNSFIHSGGWTGTTPGEYRRAQSTAEGALH